MTDLKTRIRERLLDLIDEHIELVGGTFCGDGNLADAIMREFALRPVAQGVVDSESGEASLKR